MLVFKFYGRASSARSAWNLLHTEYRPTNLNHKNRHQKEILPTPLARGAASAWWLDICPLDISARNHIMLPD